MRWFYRWYGASPLHLLTLIASFALAGYAAEKLLPRNTEAVLVWFAGAVIGHDLLLMPLYTIADRSVIAVFGHRRSPHPPTVSWVNYLRIPAVLSGLLLLIWFPLIFRLPPKFTILTGLSLDPYLGRWLGVTGVLFLLSALTLAVRLGTLLGKRQANGRGHDREEFRRPVDVTAEQPYGWGLPPDEPGRDGGLLRGPAPRTPNGPREPGGPREPDGPWGPAPQPPRVPPWERAPQPRAPQPRPQHPRAPQPPAGQPWGRDGQPRQARPPTWPT